MYFKEREVRVQSTNDSSFIVGMMLAPDHELIPRTTNDLQLGE